MHRAILQSCLKEIEFFYYLVHPADLIAPEDVDASRPIYHERVHVPLAAKLELFERSIALILESGRQIITMDALAGKVLESHRKAAHAPSFPSRAAPHEPRAHVTNARPSRDSATGPRAQARPC